MNPQLLKDILERTFWTAVEAGAAYLSTRAIDISPVWATAIAPALAVVKGYAASHVGDDTTAAAMPGGTK